MPKCLITDKIKIKQQTLKLIDKQKLNKENWRLNNGDNPIAILAVGGTAVGKTTSLKKLIPTLFPNIDFVTINSDIINETIFNGSADCRTETNDINNNLFEMAKMNKKDIIFDTTGRNYTFFMKNLQDLYLHGYTISIIIILADAEIAADRAEKRFSRGETNRSYTRKWVLNVHKQIKNVIGKYVIIPKNIVNDIYVYDNNDNLDLILFRNSNGNYKCNNQISVAKWFSNIYKTLCKTGKTGKTVKRLYK